MASHFRFVAAAPRPRLSLAVGLLLFSGTLVAQDSAELDSLLGKIPRGSHYDAVAMTHAFDLKVSRNPENAVRFLQEAANLGDPSAQTSLGYLYAMGTGVPKDQEQALRWFQRAAAEHYAPAAYDLGLMLLEPGIHHDEKAGADWLSRAAQRGLAPAQTNLAILYVKGIGVARNESEARRLAKKAADQHFAPAEFLLGAMYESGTGGKKDAGEAAHWYRKAAEQGHAQAENNLAGLYLDGVGVSRNIEEAIKWYKLAANQGEPTSYSNLMHVYADGREVTTNYQEAYRWALLAVQHPSAFLPPISDEFIESLRARISTEERTRIEADVHHWMSEHPARANTLQAAASWPSR
jgi:TPR repeat protein